MRIQNSTTTHLLVNSLNKKQHTSCKSKNQLTRCDICEKYFEDSDTIHSAIATFCINCWNDYFGNKQIQK